MCMAHCMTSDSKQMCIVLICLLSMKLKKLGVPKCITPHQAALIHAFVDVQNNEHQIVSSKPAHGLPALSTHHQACSLCTSLLATCMQMSMEDKLGCDCGKLRCDCEVRQTLQMLTLPFTKLVHYAVACLFHAYNCL